ncbi:transcription factor [Ganoderma sinense ZZ0214-1]|uniref:Transcription factor n=1 Tax=Ganoderma sinense ZZ0214-1 TaxID=1077348 RepID=A0A2G8SDQ3_9APHY|nr:transcription factor [Ganoderma sinense ZZ0214-1]
MASQDVWSDFETFRHNVRQNKVDQLKQILSAFNEECNTNHTKTGKKQDLIDKITRSLDIWRREDNHDRWLRAKAIMNRVRTGLYYGATYRTNGDSSYTHSFAPPPTTAYQAGTSGAIPRYDPYAPPRQPASVASSSAAPAPQPSIPVIRFKPSPFFKVERIVSSVVECPESTSSVDRRSQSFTFVMQPDIVSKLNSPSPKYQLRLYCTSSTYYTANASFRSPGATLCPIEFPPTCEVRVNGTQLNANLKGLKKRAGTAPPPDLGKLVRQASSATNRVEMIYVNSQQPMPPKKFYLVVMLVEVTSVDQLIDRLRKGKYKSKDDILAQMNKAASEDDDIIAGHQKMSLKCPLSYMRIMTPCRSSTCVHPQCFDAMSWFSVMEQTTTWLCPVCEKVLNVEELIIDGYFDDILKQTPDSVEDVIVEADGEWHTEDNKFASPAWKAAHPSPPMKSSPVKRAVSPIKPPTNGVNGLNGKDKPRLSNAEIVILDSDDEDEDEGRVKRELSPSTDSVLPRASQSVSGSQPPRSQTSQATDIIDLTLDSEDDEPPPPPRPSVAPKKRKETDDLPSPTEQIWKKSRTEGGSSSSPGFDTLVNNTIRMAEEARRHQGYHPSSQSRYPSSSQQASPYRGAGSQGFGSSERLPPPPPPPTLSRRPPTSPHDNYRNIPPLSPYTSQRGSGAGSSSPTNWR